MNILYLTIARRSSQKMTRDLIDEFLKNGHEVYVVCPYDVNDYPVPSFTMIDGARYLFVKSGYPVGKVNMVKKVINFLTIDSSFQKAIRKALATVHIDLVLYSTPPITLVNTINWVKKKYNAATYLMLKDIFPQNAVDLGMMKTKGVMGIAYKYFRKKEKKLYSVSDYIGCMSDANVKYVLKHNPEIPKEKVGLCVNSLRLQTPAIIDVDTIRNKYGIPCDTTVFLYGGNLGKPQGLDFLVRIMQSNKNKSDRFFVICGGGNDQQTITRYIENEEPNNVKFISMLPPDEFDKVSLACDVGMIFLDPHFTIPNFPSRLLSIILNEKPVLAATDKNTDVGDVIMNNGFGWWCESGDLDKFNSFIEEICANKDVIKEKGQIARKYYETHYTSANSYNQIIEGYNKSLTLKK